MGGRTVLWAALAVLVAGSAACGSGTDKAGGRNVPAAVVEPVGKPVTLTLDAVDELWASEYAAAVRRLSGGTIVIDVRYGGNGLVDYERMLVQQVRRGKADLASVGAIYSAIYIGTTQTFAIAAAAYVLAGVMLQIVRRRPAATGV